ncbi:hypothetical protein COCSUDRAFT_61884 [Coccomyxa subellipsoidea C-169]|uniref:Uncharacterized protein n=1 Tax=Coccomyxa subellipsoidea (strain C-169) TaxID=574566 RepID=I0Z1D9_COCSC|nr:hypothetical protein COCSUDRAFT_61884 [Coccomyxa subellipsoidea C-169]EIE24458.1 hypothetical protein COCSUDRAFT_61884 [Coccomyxa subellipsoidea C-169]|eukprot:XP_005649002.1 hypothetical protein COCSUDRAFT_61884 [Coccomyxa subellipsoidea C-169]
MGYRYEPLGSITILLLATSGASTDGDVGSISSIELRPAAQHLLGRVDSATEDASAEEDGDGADQVSQLSAEEVDKRLRKAAAFIATADSLAPYDRRTFNAALVIWDIVKLWKVSGSRYLAGRQELAEVQGPDYSLYDDFPEELNEVATFEGRAAVPLNSLFGGFRKLFFLQPRTFDLYGRVQVQKGPLGDLLYPLYYKCTIDTSTIPAGYDACYAVMLTNDDIIAGTNELSDVQLEYLDERLGLKPSDVPSTGRWPHNRQPRWPFNGGLVDHLRAVGPGVYVGVGWKHLGTANAKRFLHFMLVRKCDA